MNYLLGGSSVFFGLDVGSSAARLVQLQGAENKALVKYAYVPLDPKISMSDSKADELSLAKILSQLIKQAGVSTNKVAVGIPSSRVFTTVADVDRLPTSELTKAIQFQADSLIPTPLAESKIDWAIIGDSPIDKTKQEIILSSVSNKFIESRLDLLESIGLDVIAFEPDNLALARALTAPGLQPQLILDIGNHATDLVIVVNGVPHLTRSINTGVDAMIKAAVQNLNVDYKQAQQFIFKFGLSKEKLEGQIFDAVNNTVELLVTEVEKSIKFFTTRYNGLRIDQFVLTGGASVIPEFPLYFANKFNINVEIGNAWRNISYSKDRENELLSISNQFAVAAGLAERNEA